MRRSLERKMLPDGAVTAEDRTSIVEQHSLQNSATTYSGPQELDHMLSESRVRI